MRISVNVPVFNESDTIRTLYTRLTAALDGLDCDFEIIMINDGSVDDSADVLDGLAAKDMRIKIIHLRRNYGQTAALMAGIRHSNGEIVILMDGDLQNDPVDIPALLDKLEEGYDVVSGWRKNRKEGLVRRLPSWVANWLVSKVSGLRLHDYGCTLKAYRREVLEDVRLYGEMHRFIPVYAWWEGGRVAEIEVTHHRRKFGRSNYGLDRVPRVLLDMIVIRFLDVGLDRPIQFFGRAGLRSFGLALLAGLWAVYLKVFEGVSFILTPLPLLVALLALVGLIFIMMGLLGEVQSRVYYEAQGKSPYSIRRTRNLDPAKPMPEGMSDARRSI